MDGRELSGLDRAIVDALDVDVSPDFHARVRRRIANVPMRRPFWHAWRIVVPAAAAAGLAAAIFMTTSPVGNRLPVPSLPARQLSLEHMRPAIGRTGLPAMVAVAARRQSEGRPAGADSATTAAEPEVLVPREEIEMYRRLIATAQKMAHAIVIEGSHDIVAPKSVSEIVIDPIRIDLIAPPVGGEGDRQ